MKVIDITPQADRQRQKIRLAGYCRVSTKSEDQELFPEELFEKAADAVVLEEDGSVGIVLMNGQVIR